MFSHDVTQDQRTGDVVVIIFQRLCHGFAHGLQACEMDDRINLLFIKHLRQCRCIQQIHLVEFQALACDLLHTLQRFLAGVVQIIHNHNLITCI